MLQFIPLKGKCKSEHLVTVWDAKIPLINILALINKRVYLSNKTILVYICSENEGRKINTCTDSVN